MKELLKKLFTRPESFTPNGTGFVWFRLRYEEPEKIQPILVRLSMHHPLALRWRTKGVEQRCYLGLEPGAKATLTKMAKELGFTLEDIPEPPDALTDRFSVSDTLLTLNSEKQSAEAYPQVEAESGSKRKADTDHAVLILLEEESFRGERIEVERAGVGADSVIEDNNALTGKENMPSGQDNAVMGQNNILTGENNMPSGQDNAVTGQNNVLTGNDNALSGQDNRDHAAPHAVPHFAPLAGGDGWVYKGVLFAHDEAGKTKKLTLPKESPLAWSLPAPALGTRVNPTWPTGLVTHSEMFWEKRDWLLGRTKRNELIGGRKIQLYGDDDYVYPWLAALIAAREKQRMQTLVIDGEGSFLEHLYTEGRSFNGIHKIDVDGKADVSLNPLTPVSAFGKGGRGRDVEATGGKWLTWFRALGVPQSVEPLILEAAAEGSIGSLETLLAWLSKQAGKRYTDATNLRNFILAWEEDRVNWLQGKGNQVEELLSAGRSLWVKCPFENLRSRRGIYLSVLMAAVALPDISIVLHKVPIDVGDIPGLGDTFLVMRDNDRISDDATKVITRSQDIDLLTGMEMISGERIKGVPEYIRQLGEFEAIGVQPNLDAPQTGGDRFHMTRMSWF